MIRRYLSTLIAVGILVALWFSFTAWNKHKSGEETAKKQPVQKIANLNPYQIDSFTVTARDGTSFACAKQGSTWRIVKPQGIPADQGKITTFLQSLTSADLDQIISPHPEDLKGFGLDPPEETIQVSSRGKPFTLRLGDDTPTSSGIYAQVSGEPRVFTLTEDLKTGLEKTLFDLRDTRALTIDTSNLQRIEARSGPERYVLVKNPDGAWDVSLPPDVRADRFAVDGLMSDLQGLTMQSVVSEQKKNLASYGFAKPTLTMTLVTRGATQTLLVGKKGGQGYYAMDSALSPVFTLDEDFVTEFEKPAANLRDKNLFSWDVRDVKTLDISAPGKHWVFHQHADEWLQLVPTSKPIPSDQFSAFLSALSDLQASSFPAAKPGELDKFGFSKPAYTFKVWFGTKNQTQVVDVAESGGHVYARRATDVLPSEVSKTDLTTIENLLTQL